MDSKTKLTEALQLIKAPDWMIEKARTGYYSDFESPLETPIGQLVTDCRDNGLHGIALRAMNGEFDATKEESDAWANSEEGKKLLREFGIKP
jgi:hypothetical protein